MESLKKIIADEMVRPEELLVKTKEDIRYIQAFVEALKNEVERYAKELAGGSLFEKEAVKTKKRLLEREKNLQTLFEILHQTLGVEGEEGALRNWPKEYTGHIKEIDEIIKRVLNNSLNYYERIVQDANTSKEVENQIIPFLDRLKKDLEDLMKLVAVEETVFDRDVQLAINNHISKDFKQHAAVYAGEIASTWNNYYRSKWKMKKEVEVKGSTYEQNVEGLPYFPTFTQTILVLKIDFFQLDEKGSQARKAFQVVAELRYDVFYEAFRMIVKQIGSSGRTHSYEDLIEKKYDSIDDAFENLKNWFLDMTL